MTGGRYHRRKEKMDIDTDMACDINDDNKPCSVSRVPADFPADNNNSNDREFVGVDLFTQARKALSDRSPFDTEDANVSSIPILPTGLANSLTKHCDGRKRQKKSSSGAAANVKGGGGLEKTRGSNFWGKMEEYFRTLTVNDIDFLSRTSHFCFSDFENYFRIPVPGNAICTSGNLATLINANGGNGNGNENENGVRSDSFTVVKEENLDQSMDVDSSGSEANCLNQEDISVPSTLLQQHPFSGFEWLLCAKNKIYLSSERPSKKRKLLGGDAGLERLLAASPVEGSTSLCHYCCLGDSGDQLNRIIVCNSCNMAVHQRCYGVQEDAADSWLCSWCKQKNGVPSLERPCLLCPKPGGALKPVHKRDFVDENCDVKDFAHLFCSQWCPEVFVTDTRTMEPIMNVDGIKETRRKLICYLCKVKHGACVRCSHGACRTSFHPICAREAMHRMEVWGKSGCDEVELRAFCSKHSGVQNGSSNEQSADLSTVSSEPCSTRHQSVTVTINRPHKLKIGRKNGDKIILHLGTGSDNGKPDGSPPSNCGLHESGSNSRTQTECSDVELPVPVEAFERTSSKEETQESPNIRIILTELINQGKVNLKDIASETSIPLDSLAAFLIDDSPVPDLHGEVVSWLKRHAYIGSLQKNLKVKIKSSKALEPVGGQNTLSSNSPKVEGGPDKSSSSVCLATETSHIEQRMLDNFESVTRNDIPDSMKTEAGNSAFIHPLIGQELIKASNALGNPESSMMYASSRADGISNHGFNMDQLDMVRNLSPSEISPEEDEVEGEIIFQQHQLLQNVLSMKHLTDNLAFKVKNTLSHEIDSVREQKWDAVLVNQYFYELRETRKQGRKERRHREAQAVLAAAAAAVASSSRNSSFRKDILDESAQQASLLKVDALGGNSSMYSHQQRTKDAATRLSSQLVLMDRASDQSMGDITKDNLRICEICMRNETILSPVLVCSRCKVSVHLDCYRSVTNTAGTWHCELCEDSLTSRSSSVPALNSEDGPILAAECCLCGGNTGAFRKSVDGQWVHAFCAEWTMESSFKRGQANPVCRLDSTLKGNDVCLICCRKKGVCIKCNYGHCPSTFHPSCARSAGYYMHVKAGGGGKWQHKAYCDKHSPEQKAKAGTQKHGIEELKNVKQVRVELERLRLLCERLIKREKVKRELSLCREDVVSSSRDSSLLSALVHSPYFPADGSSESATTSVKGNTDDCRSGSEAVQRSDDVTVDSTTTVSGKRRIRFTLSMDNDQKTDDSSTSQNVMQKPSDRVLFGGKHIPYRHKLVPRPLLDDGDKWTKPKKLGETFEKELIMTSDQALKKNQRLPKGFVYVPVQCLSNEDESIQDPYSDKPLEHD
ncbi:uncharacterized protein LOC124910660 isoform X2 [Impatiens glandulifera]|uniref:uncharacterized protein LOC124910660 isoform X2 n=1 Tax=Impatiens glandulifera TaxID=253017 RepID=UPI001FB1326A|nr:uncharacterized protein LOC124910660 isoform X2 [Impatiens glandulifera]